MNETDYRLEPVGFIQSTLTRRESAPKQGEEGAPDAWIDLEPWAAKAAADINAGDELIVLTWLHLGRRDVLQVHPRGNPDAPLTGVFSTRSPDRPNTVGLHRVTVAEVDGLRLKVSPMEAVDGTPVIDIKPMRCPPGTR